MDVFSIPGKLQVTYVPEAHAIVDRWESYGVTVAQFRDAILGKALPQARVQGARAWVVDSTKATGAFAQEIQKLIEAEVFPAFVRSGIKYFITIASGSAITNMSIRSYKAKAGPSGLQVVEVPSVADAIRWLQAH